jgi:hypothetical protein
VLLAHHAERRGEVDGSHRLVETGCTSRAIPSPPDNCLIPGIEVGVAWSGSSQSEARTLTRKTNEHPQTPIEPATGVTALGRHEDAPRSRCRGCSSSGSRSRIGVAFGVEDRVRVRGRGSRSRSRPLRNEDDLLTASLGDVERRAVRVHSPRGTDSLSEHSPRPPRKRVGPLGSICNTRFQSSLGTGFSCS